MMDILKSFIFNRTVLGLLVAACFGVTALDIYFDISQSKITHSAALFAAKSTAELFLAATDINTPESSEVLNEKIKRVGGQFEVKIFTPDSDQTPFQKQAIIDLSKNPNPYYEIEVREDQSILRYAVIYNPTSKTFLELIVPMGALEALENQESIKTLLVLIILATLSSVSLAIFVGYLRHSTEVLVQTQEKALEEQKLLTYAYERFFPHQFLDLLKKKSVIDIKLGDQTEKQMAVLFADIRNFTTLIEKKTPAESFQMINDYLREVGPIIRKHSGFIDKYIGDAIMALFEKPDDALKATIDIMQLLKKNAAGAEHMAPVISEIGTGIHFGDLMVGTVGEAERMDGTVISDIANTASRLENLNRSYDTHILVSEEFLNGLVSKEKYKIRFLDHIFVKGKSKGIKIFEVFDADSAELIQKKEEMKPVFEKAMESYRNRQFQEAIGLLKECQKFLPQDPVLSIFIKRCEKYLAEGVPENWEPISKLSAKDDVE